MRISLIPLIIVIGFAIGLDFRDGGGIDGLSILRNIFGGLFRSLFFSNRSGFFGVGRFKNYANIRIEIEI